MTPPATIEAVARVLDPRSWGVMDSCLAGMLRKYKGQDIGYDPEAFKHKDSMRLAQAAITAHLATLHDAGMVVVPREPTEAMLNVDVGRTYRADEPGRLQNARRDIYRAMITAANPTP